jgi:hypothetical protein
LATQEALAVAMDIAGIRRHMDLVGLAEAVLLVSRHSLRMMLLVPNRRQLVQERHRFLLV